MKNHKSPLSIGGALLYHLCDHPTVLFLVPLLMTLCNLHLCNQQSSHPLYLHPHSWFKAHLFFKVLPTPDYLCPSGLSPFFLIFADVSWEEIGWYSLQHVGYTQLTRNVIIQSTHPFAIVAVEHPEY